MKILLIGASGTIGSAVKAELAQRHEVISIGRTSGDFQVDISDSASLRRLFEQTGKFDALICAAGNVNFVPLADMNDSDFELGLRDKLMGQVNLLLIGREYANDGASFTFTSGILNRDPIAPALRRPWSTVLWTPSSKRRPLNCLAACVSTRSARRCCWKPWAAMPLISVATNLPPPPMWRWLTQKASRAYKLVRPLSWGEGECCKKRLKLASGLVMHGQPA